MTDKPSRCQTRYLKQQPQPCPKRTSATHTQGRTKATKENKIDSLITQIPMQLCTSTATSPESAVITVYRIYVKIAIKTPWHQPPVQLSSQTY